MAEKLAFETKSLTEQNIEKLKQLFPEIITEASGKDGKIRHSVDFEKLKQVLSGQIAETHETYDFIWAGKGKAMQIAAEPIRKTLRPCQEESINWDNTENIYIEGDNLDALKLLQESYLGKVKMIYIDPPYNTGKDFIYNDNFAKTQQEYEKQTEVKDDEGNILFKNMETSGRFHSDWCSMIYPRLKIARNLLAEEGVIFVSIDDREQENLKKIMNELFGENNCVGFGQWRRVEGKPGKAVNMARTSEFVAIYARDLEKFQIGLLPLGADGLKEFRYSDENGSFRRGQIFYPNRGIYKYSVRSPYGNVIEGEFTIEQSEFEEYNRLNKIYWAEQGEHTPYLKIYLKEFEGVKPTNTFGKEYGSSQGAVKEFKALFNSTGMIFDNPKPTKLLYRLLLIANLKKDSIILDFFSGSATTAHAVMKLNSEDMGKRKFIMVQLPEKCAIDSEAAKAGYKNICEIGKERIRRAAAQIQKDNPNAQFDGGFRVFKVADSNMKDVYYSPEEYSQDMLSKMTTNIKEDRTALDLLYGCILQLGLPISCKHSQENFENIDIYSAHTEESLLVACFANNITPKVVEHIAAKQPDYAVFRDSCFKASQDKINLEERFKKISPNTKIKVI